MIEGLQSLCSNYDQIYQDFDFKSLFHLPKDMLYLAGHSLGPQPKSTEIHLSSYLRDWKEKAVDAHFNTDRGWVNYHTRLQPKLAKLCGCLTSEVVPMGSLSMNLHFMLAQFYSGGNIAMESGAFSSDVLVVQSFLKKYGDGHIIFFPSDEDGYTDEGKLEEWLELQKPSMIILSLVQYKTGQVFDLSIIRKLKAKIGFTLGLDLAHAIGNIPLHLHDWDIDFAVWCSYKYLNAGPGAIAGIFIHEKHHAKGPLLYGWWGHVFPQKFDMSYDFVPYATAEAWQLSNPSIVSLVCLESALEIFQQINLERWHQKSVQLKTILLEALANLKSGAFQVITKQNLGSMCTIKVTNAKHLECLLGSMGVKVDARGTSYIRFSFNPLYHSFSDIYEFVRTLETVLKLL